MIACFLFPLSLFSSPPISSHNACVYLFSPRYCLMDVATYSVWTRKGESYDYQLPMVKESKDRMTEIANACLLEGHHSTHCRRALVVVIPKHGRDDNSLQSTASRIREYLAEGIRESRCAILVDVMRACHQISFVLFSLGLCAYFLSTDMTTFGIVSSWFFV